MQSAFDRRVIPWINTKSHNDLDDGRGLYATEGNIHMSDSTRKTAEDAWFAAEAHLAGKTMMIRGRKLPSDRVPDTRFPFLFVATRDYDVADETGLPTREQYDEIADLEREVWDLLEDKNIGILIFVETHNGSVRYYCYVRSVEQAVALVNGKTAERVSWNLAAAQDSEWAEYCRLMAQVTE